MISLQFRRILRSMERHLADQVEQRIVVAGAACERMRRRTDRTQVMVGAGRLGSVQVVLALFILQQ